MRLQVESGLPLANGWLGAGGSVEWPNATRPGDVLHVAGEIVDIHPSKSRPDRGIVTVRSETLNQDGKIVQITTAKLVVFRRPARSALSPSHRPLGGARGRSRRDPLRLHDRVDRFVGAGSLVDHLRVLAALDPAVAAA